MRGGKVRGGLTPRGEALPSGLALRPPRTNGTDPTMTKALPDRSPDPKRQARRVVEALETLYPDTRCALVHRGPYQLLVATILSAQCTDVRVNLVTPALFARYPDPAALADAEPAELEGLIHSAGFFRAKAKNLKAMARKVVSDHGGEIPPDLDALTGLPGVGRKTANVVLGNAFAIASGVVVDTHVKRLAYRLGLTDSRDPMVIERDLIRLVPKALGRLQPPPHRPRPQGLRRPQAPLFGLRACPVLPETWRHLARLSNQTGIAERPAPSLRWCECRGAACADSFNTLEWDRAHSWPPPKPAASPTPATPSTAPARSRLRARNGPR